MGPITLFDKSFIQSLSADEAVWFDHFSLAVVCPIFYVETLADLAKEPTKRAPEASGDSAIQNGPRRLRPIKGLQWQTLVRGDIGRQRLFRPLANPGEVEASCVFRALMRYEVKQHDFKMFEGDS